MLVSPCPLVQMSQYTTSQRQQPPREPVKNSRASTYTAEPKQKKPKKQKHSHTRYFTDFLHEEVCYDSLQN